MKLINIKKIALALFFGSIATANASAQSCVGGTSRITTATDSNLNITRSDYCGYIDSLGSIYHVYVSNPLPLRSITGVYVENNGAIGVSYTGSDAVQIGIWLFSSSAGSSVINAGTINFSINGDNSSINGIRNVSSTNMLTNSGSIISALNGDTNDSVGIKNQGTISTLTNSGSITSSVSGVNPISVGIQNQGTISTLTNSGSITSSVSGVNPISVGIQNQGTISTLNNAQGGNGGSPASTALTYTGTLPVNYNIIINSPTHYGQLAVTSGTGATTFGIFGSGVAGVAVPTLNKGVYSSVLSGVASSNITGATTGNYNGFTWSLSEVDTTNDIWNLIVTGASTADTQQSLVNTASALQNTFTLQNTVLTNSFSYDCNVFGENDVCVSAGGRNTAVSAANGLNNTSALLIAAYRVMPSVRIGAYADQNLSVNNAGSTVNLGNNTPLIGVFGAWNENLDGTGTEVKVSAAYGQKNTTITRQVVNTSEPGTGSSSLNSQGAQVTAKYGFGVAEGLIVSPYIGMRYTQNNMNGYSEQATSSVTAPLTYSALNTNATTALAGVGAQYKFIPQATVFASAGVETDTNTSNGTYSATGVTGLTPINFNANPVRTRPTATVGAYYDIEKNQRLGVTGIYRQEAYQATASTTVMATYTVGF